MDYINPVIDTPYDASESQAEQVSAHQIELDELYSIGCQYSIKDRDMMTICRMAGVSWRDLQQHQGVGA